MTMSSSKLVRIHPIPLDTHFRATPPTLDRRRGADEGDGVERQVAERSMLLKHILVDVPDALNDAIPLDKVGHSYRLR